MNTLMNKLPTTADGRYELPADNRIEILKKGEWPHAGTGKVQIVDDEALEAVVNAWKKDSTAPNFPGMLVDYDHFSHEADQPTRAAAWITNIERRGDSVFAEFRWTETGKKAVEGGEYRLISPVCVLGPSISGNRHRVEKIVRVALTNDPNMKGMLPAANRADNTNPKDPMDYKAKLCNMLKLPATASDEEIESAVQAKNKADGEAQINAAANATRLTKLTEENTALANRVKEVEEKEVEALVAEYTEVVGKDQGPLLKAQFTSNRSGTLALLKPLKEAHDKAKGTQGQTQTPNRVHNPANRGSAAGAGSDDAKREAAEITANRIRTRSAELQAANRSLSFDEAWAQASREVTASTK